MPNWTKLSNTRQDFSFLLFEPFSNHVLANVLEPLRAANDLLGREAYRWTFLTVEGGAVRSSSGLPVMPHAALGDEGEGDVLVVLPSYGYRELPNPYLRRALRAASERYLWMAGVDCGAWLLADAELLEASRATIHYDEYDAFSERFPTVRAERSRWGGALWSCCGAAGLEGTRWAYRGGAEWIERRVAGLSDAEWQRRRRGAHPPTGCRDGRHEWQLPPGRLEPRCDACGSPWDESGTRGKAGCGVCGAARRLCTQCWAVLPEATFLRGGCRFHPGSFCESRTIRFATKQRSGGALVRIGTADADVKCRR